MDLSVLAPSKEAVFIQLRHPIGGQPLFLQMKDEEGNDIDNKEEPIGVFVVGTDSDEYAARERWVIDQRIKRAEEQRQGKQISPITADVIIEEGLNTILACMKGFRNVELDGRRLEDNPSDFRLFLKRLKWAKDYLDKELLNRANFIKG